jgi:hypothetical protein
MSDDPVDPPRLGRPDRVPPPRAALDGRGPTCGGTTLVPIRYGLPGEEGRAAAMRGDIVLGGCVLSLDAPTRRCADCGENLA